MKAKKSNRSTKIKIIFLILACILFGALINYFSKGFTEDKFVILSTTDMGGNIWDQNIQTRENNPNNMLAASTAIKQSRTNFDNRTITWDCGNLWQDSLAESLGLAKATNPQTKNLHSCSIVCDEIEYDGFSLGNHEYNLDYSQLNENFNYFKDTTSYVCANLYDSKTKERLFDPYITKSFKVDGDFLKVGIIGLENPDHGLWDASASYPDLIWHSPENPSADLAYEITKVQKEMEEVGEDCDFVIVSMYNGFYYEEDYDIKSMNDRAYRTLIERTNQPLIYGENTEAQAYRAVTNTTGVDMFICGCDKKPIYSNMTFKNADESKDVLVVNGAGEAVTKSVFRAIHDKENDKFEISLVSSENLNLTRFSPDQVLKNRIYPLTAEIESKLRDNPGQIVGDWNTNLEDSDYYTKQTDTADFINRAQMWAGTRIANNTAKSIDDINLKLRKLNGEDTMLQFNSHMVLPDMSITPIPEGNSNREIKNGTFTYKNAKELFPDDYYLCAVAMTGAEIKEMLEFNAEHKYELKIDEVGHKSIAVQGDLQSLPIPYGINFHYQMNKPVGHKAVIEGFSNGRDFKLDDVYVVMVNNFVINSSATVIYDSIGWNRVIYDQDLNNNSSYIRNVIDLYANTITYDYGGVYPSNEANKNNEFVSKWYIAY